jgi:hypothetical protein
MPINRQELSRKLARAIALKQVGKHDEAHDEAVALIGLLHAAGILRNANGQSHERAEGAGLRRGPARGMAG